MARSSDRRSTVKHGSSAKAGRFIGRAVDGTPIARPVFKPKSFTVRELQKVVREIQKRDVAKK